jgi:hypothetical protein
MGYPGLAAGFQDLRPNACKMRQRVSGGLTSITAGRQVG